MLGSMIATSPLVTSMGPREDGQTSPHKGMQVVGGISLARAQADRQAEVGVSRLVANMLGARRCEANRHRCRIENWLRTG